MGEFALAQCDSLESVTLLNLKKWEGIEDGQLTGKEILPKSYNRYLYRYEQQKIKFSPFYNCEGLKEAVITWPQTEMESFPTIFTGCVNLNKVVFNNYTAKPCDGEFYSVSLANHRFDSSGHSLYKRNDDLTIYCADERAREYAERIGVKFKKFEVPFEYAFNDYSDNVYIEKYIGNENIVIIPDKIEGYPVTRISPDAFVGKSFENVVIGENVKFVKQEAFDECDIEELVFLNAETLITRKGLETYITGHGQVKEMYVNSAFCETPIGVIYAYKGSDAEKYANKMGITFVAIEEKQ